MKTSIIIPAYNAEQWLAFALHSCLRQDPDFEVIIVDDGSTDDTFSVASRFQKTRPDQIRIVQGPHKGASAARNRGIDVANGQFVLFLDADDVLAEGALRALASAAEKSGADLVLGAHSNFESTFGRETVIRPNKIYRDGYANIARCKWVQGSFLLKKTELRFNETRELWEGLEYLLDYVATEKTVEYIDVVCVKVRQHEHVQRTSQRLDHFEPYMTGSFFAACKDKLVSKNALNTERASALDFEIASNAYSLLKSGHRGLADNLFSRVSWSLARQYHWAHPGSLGWCGYWGRKAGILAFYYVNRILGRT